MSLILRSVAESDRGKVRDNNEDSVHADSVLVAVSDGVGGGPAGEVASDIVVRTLAELAARPRSEASAEVLREAVEAANQNLRAAIALDSSLDGMGATLTAMITDGDKMNLAHVGDSRAYVWRGGELVRLTRDDTYVQGLVDQGVISAAEARTHPHRSLVTQAMNGGDVHPSYADVPVQAGDRFLLCSDGLTDFVEERAIARELAEHADLERCARELVNLALVVGAPDNVSVVLAEPSPLPG